MPKKELTFHRPEFEKEVRDRLKIYDRAVTAEDARQVRELDLSNFNFSDEDSETLFYFSNLRLLNIVAGECCLSFWNHFPKMKELHWECWGSGLDFTAFANMHDLNWLCVSGGDYSGMDLKNLNALASLRKLEYLILHEFGCVDLAPLVKMPQLKGLELLYANKVENIEAIGMMNWLKRLELRGLYVENLDFLDRLPADVQLDMCGIEISDHESLDVRKWKRFTNRDICEIEVKDPYWRYVDLCVLDE